MCTWQHRDNSWLMNPLFFSYTEEICTEFFLLNLNKIPMFFQSVDIYPSPKKRMGRIAPTNTLLLPGDKIFSYSKDFPIYPQSSPEEIHIAIHSYLSPCNNSIGNFIALTFFLNKYIFILFDRQSSPIAGPLPHMTTTASNWARPKLGDKHSIMISHLHDRNPTALAITQWLPQYTLARRWSWV